ncbi:hypothetical protein DIPPA_65535 [Diplonema papillatum]|nr:hypothetical protein DIPPA_65535 [Diplonema papillatum]
MVQMLHPHAPRRSRTPSADHGARRMTVLTSRLPGGEGDSVLWTSHVSENLAADMRAKAQSMSEEPPMFTMAIASGKEFGWHDKEYQKKFEELLSQDEIEWKIARQREMQAEEKLKVAERRAEERGKLKQRQRKSFLDAVARNELYAVTSARKSQETGEGRNGSRFISSARPSQAVIDHFRSRKSVVYLPTDDTVLPAPPCHKAERSSQRADSRWLGDELKLSCTNSGGADEQNQGFSKPCEKSSAVSSPSNSSTSSSNDDAWLSQAVPLYAPETVFLSSEQPRYPGGIPEVVLVQKDARVSGRASTGCIGLPAGPFDFRKLMLGFKDEERIPAVERQNRQRALRDSFLNASVSKATTHRWDSAHVTKLRKAFPPNSTLGSSENMGEFARATTAWEDTGAAQPHRNQLTARQHPSGDVLALLRKKAMVSAMNKKRSPLYSDWWSPATSSVLRKLPSDTLHDVWNLRKQFEGGAFNKYKSVVGGGASSSYYLFSLTREDPDTVRNAIDQFGSKLQTQVSCVKP